MSKKQDSTPALVSSFLALADEDSAELLREAAPQPSDLQKLRVPSGSGGSAFVLETLEGEVFEKQLDVVVAWTSPIERAFFGTEFGSGETSAPDCSSPDGLNGMGTRDIDAITRGDLDSPTEQACAYCPWSQYGSSLGGGKGQACAQKQRLIVFDQKGLLPMLLQVPPASLKALRRYKLQLLNSRQAIGKVVTKLTLEKVDGSAPYYRLKFAHVRALQDVEVTRLAGLAQALSASASV